MLNLCRSLTYLDKVAVPIVGVPDKVEDSLDEKRYPIRSREQNSNSSTPAVTIHPLKTQDGVIIKVQPPTSPANMSMSHVPCDIVLVIDVSGSMGADAPVPTNPGERSERFGLSVLDLVKHAALTILETLDDRDRLGIVTFATKSKVIQPLTFMNKKNKKKAKSNIESMYPLDMTNLWHGIRDSLGLFDGDFDTGRVPAVMVLTDGLPNHMYCSLWKC